MTEREYIDQIAANLEWSDNMKDKTDAERWQIIHENVKNGR